MAICQAGRRTAGRQRHRLDVAARLDEGGFSCAAAAIGSITVAMQQHANVFSSSVYLQILVPKTPSTSCPSRWTVPSASLMNEAA